MTAVEEKSYIVEIEKIESSIDYVEKLEELQTEYIVLKNGLKGIDIKNLNEQLKVKFNRLKELYETQAELKKAKKGQAGAEAKPQMVSEQETKLIKKKEEIQKKIDQIKADTQTVFENYQLQRRNYEQALFEENKRFFMLKLQRELKYEERKKEIEQMKNQKEKELVERERAKLGLLY